MKKIFISIALVSLVSTTTTAFDEVAFTDKLLDNAELQALPKAELLEAPAHIQSSLENETYIESSNSIEHAVVSKEFAGARVWGKLCNIVHTPNGQYKWSINRYDLETDSVETIFGVSNNRKIQSVACDPYGYNVLFSMKETLGGDFEIYSLDPNEGLALFKLTDNDTDDVDVTINWGSSVVAWQNRLTDDRQAILLTRFDFNNNNTPPIVKSLASASPFVQPSLSANGKWLTFVQLRPSFFAVMRYDIENNKYLEIRKIPRRKRLFHPSISNDGNVIGWAENRKQNRYMVKNLSANTLTQILNNSNGIEHASVSANGDMVTYSVNAAEKRQTYMTHLETLNTTRIGSILYGTNRYLGTSWLGTSLQDIQLEDISGQSFVALDGPFVLAFRPDGSGTEISDGDGEYSDYPDPYAADFNWTVNDGQLFVDYESDVEGSVDVSLASINSNQYTIIGEDSEGSGVGILYKALPLSMTELDGKVMALNMAEGSDCSLITFAFEGTKALGSAVCSDDEGDVEVNYYNVTEDPSIDNVIVLTRDEETLHLILTQGSISEGGKMTFIDQDADETIDAVITHDVSFEDGKLANLILGKTLYRHINNYGEDGVDTLVVGTNGQLAYSEFGRTETETIPYEILGNTLVFLGSEQNSSGNEGAILVASTPEYVTFADAVDETTTFYYTEADALTGPIDSGRAPIAIDDGITNTVIKFVDNNGGTTQIPSDAYIRIIPRTFTELGQYQYSINCFIEADGSFEQSCFADLEDHSLILDAMEAPNQTYQIVVFQNHLETERFNWNCGENTYKYVGSSESNWSNITVTPTDFQDRSNENCS